MRGRACPPAVSAVRTAHAYNASGTQPARANLQPALDPTRRQGQNPTASMSHVVFLDGVTGGLINEAWSEGESRGDADKVDVATANPGKTVDAFEHDPPVLTATTPGARIGHRSTRESSTWNLELRTELLHCAPIGDDRRNMPAPADDKVGRRAKAAIQFSGLVDVHVLPAEHGAEVWRWEQPHTRERRQGSWGHPVWQKACHADCAGLLRSGMDAGISVPGACTAVNPFAP